MTPEDIGEVLEREAARWEPVDPALLERISGPLVRGLRPVRPPAPGWLVAAVLFGIFCAVSLVGAARLGFYGILRLSAGAVALIFPVLGALAGMAAAASVRSMRPGSKRLVDPLVLLGGGSAAFVAVFALLFHDYRMEGFWPQGLRCLKAGLIWAIPAVLAAWLVLRRGFAVNAAGAGLAAGSFAGLAGLGVLELHCPNFKAPHVMVWHVAVVPLSGLAGALAARAVHFFGSKRRAAELMQ